MKQVRCISRDGWEFLNSGCDIICVKPGGRRIFIGKCGSEKEAADFLIRTMEEFNRRKQMQ